MQRTTIVKTGFNATRVRDLQGVQAKSDIISKGGMTVLGGVAGLVGLWAVACFAGALASRAGVVGLVRGWFGAVFGM
ncbi:MAG: hypothetical protein A2511_07105 [Deltaproteobacteria bacterium RIFOXYD12_FULL_50_9]|nr:MAG: hypothetical protein A2511_07105 [Deltaproteobacteria bacterium RIFOXYD12_FULL_50_9]